MAMAKAAKDLFESKLHYSDGTKVKAIIADTTIGRVAEAAACEEKFRKAGVDITLTVTASWCYGSETMDMNPLTIKGVWGFNATERPGAVYLAAVLAAHAQKGLPAFGIYGREVCDMGDSNKIPADAEEKLLRFGRAAIAAATMRGKSYLQIGSMCMGIAGSSISTDFFEEYLGMRVESVDEVEIIRRMEEGIFDEAEFKKAMEWVKQKCVIGFDKNPPELKLSDERKERDLEFVVKMMCIIKDMLSGNQNLPEKWKEEAVGHNAIAGGFQGQRQWTDFYPNADFPESLLNSSFDWNGAREPYILATENDTLNAVSMLFGKLLHQTAQVFADVRTFWSAESVKRVTGYDITGKAKEAGGFIHLINSGAAAADASGVMKNKNGEPAIKPFWEVTDTDIENCMNSVTWNMADLGYFRGGGYSSRFETRAEMPVTLLRLNLVKGIGPVMQIAEGYTVCLPREVSDILWKRTDYTWPCTWFAPRVTGEGDFTDAYQVMNTWGANHGSFGYGHFGADVITLCSMLRIPVCMHNVRQDKIFRPASWNSFGIDAGGRDFNACKAYGPLYRICR
jgi:L-fucose isomerase